MLKETYNKAIIIMSRFADGMEMSRTLVDRCLWLSVQLDVWAPLYVANNYVGIRCDLLHF